jgi:galactokinase
VTCFERLYGHRATTRRTAPGRVNLIGEHTDYNGGRVLPTAIRQHTVAELGVRGDDRVRAWSRETGHAIPEQYLLGEEARGRGWLDYVQGVTASLARAGIAIRGFDLRIESTVPLGSGLSSSASLEVAVLRAVRSAFALPLDDLEIARLAQRGENELVGAPVGIMDPLACSVADATSALLVETRTLELRRVPLPRELELVVISSGIAHEHAGGDYRTRRAECERAARLLGVELLSELEERDLARAAALPEPLGRRVRHVVTENARVLAAVAALEHGDTAALGAQFAASHASMRDDYQVSIAAIDRLVELAVADPDIVGARLTGGGFGGSIVAFARAGAGARAARRVAEAYRAGGGAPEVLVPEEAA